MDHTHIVHANDLHDYADRLDSQATLPELIHLLITQSCSDLTMCRIPYGNDINQPGFDGLVEVGSSFHEFVPEGRSYWEIGVGNPKQKATDDFKKRTKELSDEKKSVSSFVFVTPRSSGSGRWDIEQQEEWIDERKNLGWKHIKIIDGVKIANWLREFPAIGRWLFKKIGLSRSLSGLSTPSEHWEIISGQKGIDDPPIPPVLFTEGRDSACKILQSLFDGNIPSRRVFFFAESESDVDDFVAAYIESLNNKELAKKYANLCLYINEEDAWRSVVDARSPHILVASPRLGLDSDRADLQTIATRKGHSIIVPLCGVISSSNPEIIKLRSPNRHQIEAIFRKSGYSDGRARELAGIGDGQLSALRRYFLGLPLPPYVKWDSVRLLAQAGLLGKWNANNSEDLVALETFLGNSYGEWIEMLRVDTMRSDSPLIQIDEKWRFVARGEVWNALGSRIADADLDRFKEIAINVLGERDPKFDLPEDDRFAAAIYNKNLKYSHQLREGLAETLALMGSRPEAIIGCSMHKAEMTATLIVRELLKNAKWDCWASLDRLLPMLAEAAPDEFLDSIEEALYDLVTSPFNKIFAQESNGVGGANYISGMLWALETLAWSPEYFARVSMILADLAAIDPGGNWANRPINSLSDIFLPWHVQTCASLEQRQSAVKAIYKEQPEICWKLLLNLLPNSHGVTMGCHRPIWRNFILRDWKEGATVSDYWKQISVYTEICINVAKSDIKKMAEIIDRLPDLQDASREILINYMNSAEMLKNSEENRFYIWDKLSELIRKHRNFSDAEWAMPEEFIAKIDKIASKIIPDTPELKYGRYFSDNTWDFISKDVPFSEHEKMIVKMRVAAMQEILTVRDYLAVKKFCDNVDSPYFAGNALGYIENEEIEYNFMSSLLEYKNDTDRKIIYGYVWGKYWSNGWEWVDKSLEKMKKINEKNNFLMMLAFEANTWKRVALHLGKNENLYWENTNFNSYQNAGYMTIAIEKFLEYRRPIASVICISHNIENENVFDEEIATKALLSVIETENVNKNDKIDRFWTVRLIKKLQDSSGIDLDSLFKIEWNFLPLLDRFSEGSPKMLELRLSSDPKFFAQVISLIFRSKNDVNVEVEIDEDRISMAKNAYALIDNWKICPGMQMSGKFDEDLFKKWVDEVKEITKKTGHDESALRVAAHVFTYAPQDPDGLWIHNTVALVLNERGAYGTLMRQEFTIKLSNQRGVYSFTSGEEEHNLAQINREKADELEKRGHVRFATAMREFARNYDRQAKNDSERDLFES